MKEIKCVCGHVNPIGTILCESCGRALTDEAKQEKLHDMRYEGSARRSQTYNKTIVDKIWNFFSSVKVGVWLIVITLIASALGTILPQEEYINSLTPEQYYKDEYGWFGELWFKIGFQDLYSSWWYLLLVASIGVSLVICSLDRFIPLHRALKTQKIGRHEGFLKRQRLYIRSEVELTDNHFDLIKQNLKAKRYKIREEDGSILAEKGRFSRWGPYVNHIGLIIFLIGALLRSVPGMYVDETLKLREGEKKVIPGTHSQYVLENKKFILETYDKNKDKEKFNQALDRVGTVAKNFQTNVTLYKREDGGIAGESDKLKKVKDYSIRVNDPLKMEHYRLYQMSYTLDELKAMSFKLQNKKNGQSLGEFKIDLYNPKDVYDLKNGYKVELMGYYPDFSGISKEGEPQTKTSVPNNPAFLFNMISPEHPKGEVSLIGIKLNQEPLGENDYKIAFSSIDTRNATILTVRKDLTLWILALGGLIFMIGVVQGMYWNHRRIWIRRVNGEVLVAAHTNKNWYGIKNEIKYILQGTNVPEPVDQQDKKKDKH
ncbi:cytochrome c biogenesis protein ResB [Heyndrickxia oleronia]|jgi:cytochrome c biogenesis protein|uniref:cytochrome c biogenesis protein ResB n=1 Tax=Heyndrickxia oleronia TaxID=38875 RepID=UPI00242FA10B|nr:cytochrome c biogenesis protein ResB [Heyndrickxia oleronia]MCI1592105.1 cytochrome c biogenesis protein ResB [Heyndrickxia oleronia]MCI1612241.1 cytochrome c biogenesis protein ResB [Heyndrickxia oleronia]MCI1745313.1 cytochrome c biogenesis protein ResB [Heyndrickxia oleronia]MCI1762020.1 cytochrome c biogenesis protein ResB [Heyndrickxia oleronia]